MHLLGYAMLAGEILFSLLGLYSIWGMWVAVNGKNPNDGIDHEWDAIGVFIGAFVGLVLGAFTIPMLSWGWTRAHWYVHLPAIICGLRAAAVMAFNS